MNLFLRSFWLSLFVMGSICFFGVHFWWGSRLALLPPRPPFPAARDTYIAAYGDSGYTVHYLYRFGLFGMRHRIRDSDVLLLGPSHVEVGLSAAQLSDDLSAVSGRRVSVYNLGIGYGDSLPFDRKVLAANKIQRKAAVIDLYFPNGGDISGFGQKVENSSGISAYLYVTDLWLRATDDWFLDPYLPEIRTDIDTQGRIKIKLARQLHSLITRSWRSGDTVDIWRPETGFIYVDSPSRWDRPFSQIDPAGLVHTHDLALTADMQTNLQEREIRPVYTLLPYDGYLPERIPNVARPYIQIAPDDLGFIDTNHLNAASRKIATDRLFLGIKKSGLLSSWLQLPTAP